MGITKDPEILCIYNDLCKRSKFYSISLVWVMGDEDSTGNIIADYLSKCTENVLQLNWTIIPSYGYLKSIIIGNSLNLWNNRYVQSTSGQKSIQI